MRRVGLSAAARTVASVAFVSVAIASAALASSTAAWEMTTFQDFVKGKFDGVALGRDGRLSLAPRLDTLFASGQPVIWSVAEAPDGALYAGTGHRGRVFRIDPDGKSTLIWTADHPEVFAVVVDSKGVVYAASSPDGRIYRIENGRATEYFNPKAKYIWSLALAADGTLYAGTGDDGRVFRITAAGKGEVWYSTGQSNVTGLMLDPQGRLLAGTEPNGILYRITAKDKAFALYDSTLPEIRAVAPNADGSVYAVALGGALARKVKATQSAPGATADPNAPADISVTVTAAEGDLKPVEPPKPAATAAPVTTGAVADASAAPANVEKSAIYRINADNTVETLWSSKEENVYDIVASAEAGGPITFGTDVNGRVYQLSADRRLTLLAQTNEAEIIRLLSRKGSLLAATGNMGKIYSLGPAGAMGTYESPVFDAGGVAQWGRLRWQGSGSVALRTRSGNSLHPDSTWSDWSEPVRDGKGSAIKSPNARFLQYQAELTGTGASVESIAAAYLPQNNPPAVHSVTVMTSVTPTTSAAAKAGGSASSTATTPYTVTVTDSGDAATSAATGTPTQTLSRAASQQLLVSWQADDPDGDRLVFELAFRGEGEREWKTLKRDLHETVYTMDGDALADGRYFFRVTASDREANPGASAREATLESSPVLIDNTPPAVRVLSSVRSGAAADIAIEAADSASALRRAEWSLDAGPWTAMAPVDGILDSETEQFRLHIANVPAGEHVVTIRVADSGGNAGLAKVVLN